MLDIESRILQIRELLEEDTESSVTYAALESRLTIELICYDRLRMSYGYIAYDDLKKWQPSHVVRQVVEDANELAASAFTIDIASGTPGEEGSNPTLEEYQSKEYVRFGEQSELKIRKLNQLWNGLSRIGSHVRLPKRREEDISSYGRRKI